MSALKRNAVILAVLLFVCVAAYLNWSYNRGEEEAAALAGASSQGEQANTQTDDAERAGLYFESDAATLGDTTDAGDGTGAVISDSTGSSSDYFAEARLNRTQARDSAMSLLTGTTETENASQDVIDSAAEAISVMAAYTLQEAQVENLIIAKGFSDCVAFINDGGITVTVPAPEDGLSAAAVARITDIVTSETGISTDNIKIIEIN